ncbi:TPA: GAF domain-containing sensor histidine kinase [Staphylococcus aureus]
MEQRTRLALLKEIAEFLNEETEMYSMTQGALKYLIEGSNFTTGWIFFINSVGEHELVSHVALPQSLTADHCHYIKDGSCWCVKAFNQRRLMKASNIVNCSRINLASKAFPSQNDNITHHATVPLKSGQEQFGILNVASPNTEIYSDEDLELLESVAFQLGSAIKRIYLTDREKEAAKINERNRLARDLHDSVNQMLLSVKLTAHAAYGMSNESIAKQAFKTIEETSQNAVNEMRALIWQLKPVGLEQGLIHALTAYSKLMHIQLNVNVEGLIDLSNEIEENIYRALQECINNVKKHADTNKMDLTLKQMNDILYIDVIDYGQGFEIDNVQIASSHGINNIKQRVKLLRGKVTFHSQPTKGTQIQFTIPIK